MKLAASDREITCHHSLLIEGQKEGPGKKKNGDGPWYGKSQLYTRMLNMPWGADLPSKSPIRGGG